MPFHRYHISVIVIVNTHKYHMVSKESKHFYSGVAIPIYILRNFCFDKGFLLIFVNVENVPSIFPICDMLPICNIRFIKFLEIRNADALKISTFILIIFPPQLCGIIILSNSTFVKSSTACLPNFLGKKCGIVT